MGTGKSYGAISVVNAMLCDIGSTIGVALETNAVFTKGGKGRNVSIVNDPDEEKTMAYTCVSETYSAIGIEEPRAWELIVDSEIPVSKGLKSSSSACNAIISAILDEEGVDMDVLDMIKLGVSCARIAGVTVTGSFDDACGCHLGGLVVTDNATDTLLAHRAVGEYDVAIMLPKGKIRKKGLSMEGVCPFGTAEECAHIAESNPFGAMVRNGSAVAGALRLDNGWAPLAMGAGALGAGISGTGPAIAAVFEKGAAEGFLQSFEGDYILTETRDPYRVTAIKGAE